MRIRFAHPRRPWYGTWVIPTAADRHPAGIHLNRYPGEVIGLWLSWGGRRYLSWVWPLRLSDLRLTREQHALVHGQLLEVLRRHERVGPGDACTCGKNTQYYDTHAQHLHELVLLELEHE